MKNYNDPHKAREAKKYDNPIPSRELMLEVMNEAGHPLGFTELTDTLKITEQEQLDAIKYRLRAMERDGQILFNRSKKYLPVEKADLVAGRVQGHPDGFGFLVPDDESDDLYLHGKQMRKVLHGDRVLASVTGVDRKGRREGAIVEIIEHNTESVVGRYFVESGLGFVTPDNSRIAQDILIPPESSNGAKSGQIVVAKIVEFPTSRHQPIGKIAEVLGDHMAPGMEIEIALRSHDLPHIWPTEVAAETDKLSEEVLEEDKKGRVDLRKMPLVTIDGEDSRDFDDAVYCERNKKGNWILTVAIADVSHYVQNGSALNKEALNRATSVYFPAEVIPMLPEKISNGLCSLNPKVDRLCMVCEATITPEGEVTAYNFKSAVMNSHARLTYTKMAAMVVDQDSEHGKNLREEYKDIVDHLDDLYTLYAVLRKAREERGSIDFETTETQIIFGKDRKIENIKPTTRNDAHRIIEECMVTANMCAARFLKKHKIPALHRVHRGPEVEKLFKVNEFLNGLGLKLGGGAEPQPSDYAALLASVKHRPDARLIQTVMLRSMSRAQYEPVDKENPESTRHFGLARKDYAHFTSPIRRYPDLLVHRAILHILKNGSAEGYIYDYAQMKALGTHSSECEQRADDASRDVMAWLKAEYMQDKVGETFTGIISTVTNFGLFVELDDVYVEGLVHVSALRSDYYHFDQAKHQMVGENSGKSYRLGDSIEVLVARVDLDDRKIDFTLPGSDSSSGDAPDRGSRKPKKTDKYKKDKSKKGEKKNKKKKRTTPKNEKKAKKKLKFADRNKSKK